MQYKGDKIHARHGYRWRHPVHEVLSPSIPEVQAEVGLQIHHHPDGAKPRSYLPLLELAVQEDPDDDRNAHYLARELYYRGQPARAAYEFKRHLALPRAVWAPERARSMMFLARVEPEQAEAWLLRACAEDAGHRDAWHDLADLYYRQGRWAECLAAAERCLSIGDRELSYISLGEAWGPNPYDYAAIACFRLGRLSQAVEYGQRALDEAPGDLRLANNLRQYEEAAGAVE